MIGYFYINSRTFEMNDLTKEVYTKFNIYIQYDDSQFINTDLAVYKINASFEDAFDTGKKYFKGELKLMN